MRINQEVLISSKNGIGEGLQPVPPEQEGGKEKNKSFSLQGGTLADPMLSRWWHHLVTLVSLCAHPCRGKLLFLFLPSLLLRGDRL